MAKPAPSTNGVNGTTPAPANGGPPGSSQTLKRNSRLSRFFHKLGHPKKREGSAAGSGEVPPVSQPPQQAGQEAAPSNEGTAKGPEGQDALRDSAKVGGVMGNGPTSVTSTEPDSRFSGDTDAADPNASIRPITPSSIAANSFLSRQQTRPDGSASRSSPPPTDRFETVDGGADGDADVDDPDSQSSPRQRPESHPSVHSLASHSTDARTFASSSHASTKPTTIMSLDAGGTNRIAQANSPSPPSGRPGELAQPSHSRSRRTGGARLDGAAAAPSPAHTRHPSTSNASTIGSLAPPIGVNGSGAEGGGGIPAEERSPTEREAKYGTVPRYSLPHPSQNPHPTAAPTDNASILTLASSGFAPSSHALHNLPPDEDASVRALAPSRRESQESLSSRWSAAFPGTAHSIAHSYTGGGAASLRTTGTGVVTTGSLLRSELGGGDGTGSSGSSVRGLDGAEETEGDSGVVETLEDGDEKVEDDEGLESGLVTAPTSPMAI